MESYHSRALEFGLAPKESIQAIVTSHIEQGRSQKPLFLDVRSDAERAESQLKSIVPVVHIIVTLTDTNALEEKTVCPFFPNKQDPIIVFCRSGKRAHVARVKLQSLGYEKVYNAGGLEDLHDSLNVVD